MKHGAAVAEKGLDALKLGQCGTVLCAGDLSYELDETGLHKCTWSCPGDEMPDKFQVVAADFRGAEKKVNMTMHELEDTGKMFEEDAQQDPEHFEKSKIYKAIKGVKFKFHNAFSGDPLKLFQMKAPTDLGTIPMQCATMASVAARSLSSQSGSSSPAPILLSQLVAL